MLETQVIGAGLPLESLPCAAIDSIEPIRCQPTEAELTKAAEEILSWVAFKETDGHWWGHDTDCGNPVPEAVAILKRLLRGEA